MRLRSRKTVFVALALIMMAAIPIGVHEYHTWRNGSELAEAIAELDRSGVPWRLADLERQRLERALPDERNSAIVIRKAKAGNTLWRAFPEGPEFDFTPNQELSPEVIVKLSEAFEKFEECLHEARRLVKFQEGRFQYTIAPDVISTLIPHVQDVREVGMLLKHDALLQIQLGDFEQAAVSCRAIVNASHALREERFLISHLVRHAILREAIDVVERMCAQGVPRAKLLAELEQLFREELQFDGWTLGLEGERAGMHELFLRIAEKKVDMQFVRALSNVGRRDWRDWINDQFPGPSARTSHAWLLRHLTDLMEARHLPPAERTAKLKELGKQVEEAPEPARALMLSVWRSSMYRQQVLETKLSATIAGLAAERFRQARKVWPEKVEDLVPEFLAQAPIDPYHGTPLRLRATQDGIVLFSSGPDDVLQGDAWDRRGLPDFGKRHDHEFRLWNPDKRRIKKLSGDAPH